MGIEGLFKDIFILFIGYLLYKFIFGFIVPIARTTKQVRRQMQDMQSHMQEQFRQQQQQQEAVNNATHGAAKRPIEGDYIDYEEVK